VVQRKTIYNFTQRHISIPQTVFQIIEKKWFYAPVLVYARFRDSLPNSSQKKIPVHGQNPINLSFLKGVPSYGIFK